MWLSFIFALAVEYRPLLRHYSTSLPQPEVRGTHMTVVTAGMWARSPLDNERLQPHCRLHAMGDDVFNLSGPAGPRSGMRRGQWEALT